MSRHDSDEVARTVAALARVGFCYGPSFASDGRRLAFISNLSGLPQVWTVAAAGGWPGMVTSSDDPVDKVIWSPAGALLALSLAPAGGMNTQVYLVRPDGMALRRITAGGSDNNWLGPWTHDGSAVFISSNRSHADSMDAYCVDVSSGGERLVARNPGMGTVTSVSRDGRRAALFRERQRSDSDVYLLELETGREILLTPHEDTAHFATSRCSSDGRTVYLTSNRDRDLSAFVRVQIDDQGNAGPLETMAARDDAELEHFELSEDGRTIALVWNRAGRNELALLDTITGEIRPVSDLPAEIVVDLAFAPQGRTLAMTLSGSTRPMDVWLFDVDHADWTQLTYSPHAGVDLAALVQPELVRFPAHDGLELTGWLYRPHGFSAPGPIVLDFHGGPEGQARPIFNATYQALLSEGIAVLAPNVRGSAGFGKRFVNLDNGPLRVDAIRDINACVDFVVQAGVADPTRIGISGGSYGGYMTMAGLVEYPELFAAGANLFGIVNFETFFEQTEPWMAAISKIEYGDPDTERDLLRRLSPIHRIDRVRAPTLVLHGANDTNVPVVEAEQVVSSLRQRGVPVEYILFPDEGHGFRKTANRIHAATAIVRWFVTHLSSPRNVSTQVGPS